MVSRIPHKRDEVRSNTVAEKERRNTAQRRHTKTSIRSGLSGENGRIKPNINREIHNSSEHRAANMANCLSVSAFRLFCTERWCIFVASLELLRTEDFPPLNWTREYARPGTVNGRNTGLTKLTCPAHA
ncbi:hypothetical protein BaRGS_00019872 [Batillaria attramentaria]|uniref:Uncharacterized protein n=1 Tax=Batillaria attramentaria TaxID=370345 RepID=A0ABD0KPF2_9CAEN